REVVAEAGVDLDVVRATDRVDRAVPPGNRAELRLLFAQPGLEPPVDTLAVRSLRVGEHQPPADVGDVGVRKRADELGERVRSPGRVRVREDDDLAARLPDG